jgi:hypothetical protein
MTTEVLVPSIGYELTALAPYVLQSCVLAPPPPAPAPQPEEAIFTPVPPGIEYESLPVLDPATQIIDTSPSQIIGCANALPDGGEQGTLNALFPDAVDGDGVVNRQNNDIWKYDGTTWENVGPTPGPQVVVVSVLPPWNEIAIYDARIRTRLQVVALDYALALLTEPDPIGVVLGLDARRVRIVAAPALTFTLAAQTPQVSSSARVVIPTESFGLEAFAPTLLTRAVVPVAALNLSALVPATVGRPRIVVAVPAAALLLEAPLPVAGGGVVVNAPAESLNLSANVPLIVQREPSFALPPVNLNLSDQPTGVSFGSFPLTTL